MDKIRVLIADDTENIRQNIENIIKDNAEKFEVIGQAKDGQEEYKMILELKPDLVMSDMQMPEMNGLEVLDKITQENSRNDIRFVLITGERDITTLRMAQNLGVFKIVYKPFTEEQIINVLNEIIEDIEFQKSQAQSNLQITEQNKETFIVKLKKWLQKIFNNK